MSHKHHVKPKSLYPRLANDNNNIMTIDTEKAKHALATLQEEKRVQQDRLQLAAQAKQHLDQTIAQRTQLPISNRVFRAN